MADPVQNQKPLASEFFIQGLTSDGKQFRPSDWAERLCGVMSCFQPQGAGGPNAHLQYSPYVRPTLLGGVKSVVVSEELREIEPLAYHFVLDFAKDNDLQVVTACLLPEPGEKKSLSDGRVKPQFLSPVKQAAQRASPSAELSAPGNNK